jgi:hypothetical protein
LLAIKIATNNQLQNANHALLQKLHDKYKGKNGLAEKLGTIVLRGG